MWVLAALGMMALPALGDLAYEWEPYPYGGAEQQLPAPGTGVVLGAGIGSAMVFIALLPAIGTVLLAGVRRGKMPKWRAALDFALLAGLGLAILAVLVLVSSHTLAVLVSAISPAMLFVCVGTFLFAAVASFVALHTKQKSWLVATAVLAASLIVFLACALYQASLVEEARAAEAEGKVPITREEWDRIQREHERVHNEDRMRMLEKRRRELEWRHGHGGGE